MNVPGLFNSLRRPGRNRGFLKLFSGTGLADSSAFDVFSPARYAPCHAPLGQGDPTKSTTKPSRFIEPRVDAKSYNMKLKDIVSTRVEAVGPDDSIQEAARRMSSLDVGALPVIRRRPRERYDY
jgi:hypothetical protein